MYFRNVDGQLARWLVKLQLYDFSIVYRLKRKHRNADARFRRPSAKHVCVYCLRREEEDKLDGQKKEQRASPRCKYYKSRKWVEEGSKIKVQ